MAWRSSGSTNDEMVNNLKRFGVISSMPVEDGFRNVDRALFVPPNLQDMAYADQPLRDGKIHLSAPHIYGSVLEALELQPASSMSFLNAGSGSGYLTCISATILGPQSSHYCVEIHKDVVTHCKQAVENWKSSNPYAQAITHIDVIHGNALEIDVKKGESALGFDRIYIGAAIERESLSHFKKMLKPGGILVGPVEDELVKIVRSLSPPTSPSTALGSSQEFSHQVLSGVRFAPLLAFPEIETVIPARIWNPSIHKYFPESFRNSCKEILLCSHAKSIQPVRPQQPKTLVNVASMLPRALWMEVLSFTHRDWFKASESEVEFLRRRLKEERANAERANIARLEAETRCQLAERERDVHQLLARRWKARLHSQLGETSQGSEAENMEEAAAAMILGRGRGLDNHHISILDLFQSLHARSNHHAFVVHGYGQEEEDDDDDDDDEVNFDESNNISDRMDEDEEVSNASMTDVEDESDDETGSLPDAVATTITSDDASKLRRHQPRTVSISGEDDL